MRVGFPIKLSSKSAIQNKISKTWCDWENNFSKLILKKTSAIQSDINSITFYWLERPQWEYARWIPHQIVFKIRHPEQNFKNLVRLGEQFFQINFEKKMSDTKRYNSITFYWLERQQLEYARWIPHQIVFKIRHPEQNFKNLVRLGEQFFQINFEKKMSDTKRYKLYNFLLVGATTIGVCALDSPSNCLQNPPSRTKFQKAGAVGRTIFQKINFEKKMSDTKRYKLYNFLLVGATTMGVCALDSPSNCLQNPPSRTKFQKPGAVGRTIFPN